MSELISITFGDLLEDVARRYPDRLAIKYIDRPYQRTWKEFDEEVTRIAKGFLKMGINKGDHVAIWATITGVAYYHVCDGKNRCDSCYS